MTPPPAAPLTTGTAALAADALFLHALNVALVELLPLPDVVRLLSTCRALRRDVALANHALRSTASAGHWRTGCGSDWCSLRPTTTLFDGRGWAFCGGDAVDCLCNASVRDSSTNENSTTTNSSSIAKRIQRSAVRQPYAVQYLSMAGFVGQRLYKWSFSSVSLLSRVEEWEFWQRVQDTRFVCRPLVVPLHSLPHLHASNGERSEADQQQQQRWWLSDQDAVRAALNKTVVSCALCDWRERVIREYTARSPAMLSLGTTQIQHLHLEEDAILREVLGYEAQLPEWLASGDLRRHDAAQEQQQQQTQTLAEWLYCALCRYHRRQCETFYQPLKQLFAQQGFSFVAAVDVNWVDGEELQGQQGQRRGGATDRQPTQLLAGVSPSGFLVGLYRMDLAGAR